MARAPALHFAIVGLVLFAGTAWLGPESPVREERVVLDISRARVALVREELALELGRGPTDAELGQALDALATDEILLRHAITLGLDRESVVEHRLAQIATFVDSSDEAEARLDPTARAEQARSLGLHKSDQVVRNILLDRVARLIRAAVLSREPDDATLAAYLQDHVEAFRRAPRIALMHVEWRTGEDPRTDAERALVELKAADPDVATLSSGTWGDRPSVPSVLPALSEREIARRLGHGFVEALATVPDDQWVGPIPSRYGWHVVKARREPVADVPSLEAVRDEVRARLRHDWAEQWFDARVQSLREGYSIRIAGLEDIARVDTGSVVGASTEGTR